MMNKSKPSFKILIRIFLILISSFFFFNSKTTAQRIPVLNQIDLPHNYYFRELYLPQLTSRPSTAAWMPDGKRIIFSMTGSLWMQDVYGETATQLTDGNGYDYQPDVSNDGNKIIFIRYNGIADELMLLDISEKKTYSLTNNNAVNLEPRWSPDGKQILFVSTINTGHFLLYRANVENNALKEMECLTPDKKSETKRYYYSAYNHAINPVWGHNGKEIYFVSNNEIAHGTGDIVCMQLDSAKTIKTIQHEETNWRTKPDISPDGTRLVYSSYLGRNWHQLWMIPAQGGYAMPLTYGDYDNTCPRWSPDGKQIAFISNREGNTSLWLINSFTGEERKVITKKFQYIKPQTEISVIITDENNLQTPCRVSITGENGKVFVPQDAWIQADDSRYPVYQKFETHYFHSAGNFKVSVPKEKISLTVSHGPEYEILKTEMDASANISKPIILKLKRLNLPANFGKWQSGDLHVHMNYCGNYLATPSTVLKQAQAENLNYVFNLIVNKEQRIPDVNYFSNKPDNVSTNQTQILYGQEFHTSYWGHLDLLNINQHLIIPGYAGYPYTAAESIFPHNSFIEDEAHKQNGLVGYAHPFDSSEIFPQSPNLTNELPADAALGKVDFYELIGFADHKASEAVWYHLLNCGIKIPAGAGTDAMTNYASLRGPVGLNRVYVNQDGPVNKDLFLSNIKAGKSFVTNGPLLSLQVNNASAGDSILMGGVEKTISYKAMLRSNTPVEFLELVWNGNIIAKLAMDSSNKNADVSGTVKVKEPGWLLLRAWSINAHPDLPDMYAYASTNPIYFISSNKKFISKKSAEFFLEWVQRLEAKVLQNNSFRNDEEKNLILSDMEKAETFYKNCIEQATAP